MRLGEQSDLFVIYILETPSQILMRPGMTRLATVFAAPGFNETLAVEI